MTSQPIKSRTKDRLPRVGVLALSKSIAQSLARELGLSNPVLLSPQGVSSGSGRGVNLSALIVEDTLWPMRQDVAAALLPCLSRDRGYILKLSRIEPRDWNKT
jgi:hypothetical protein